MKAKDLHTLPSPILGDGCLAETRRVKRSWGRQPRSAEGAEGDPLLERTRGKPWAANSPANRQTDCEGDSG